MTGMGAAPIMAERGSRFGCLLLRMRTRGSVDAPTADELDTAPALASRGLRLVERSSTQPLAGICQRILVNPCEALRGRSLKRSNASESERIIRQ